MSLIGHTLMGPRLPPPLNCAGGIVSNTLTTTGSESLTGLDILSGLGDRVHLLPSVLRLSQSHSFPLTSGNVESPIADGKPNMVQPGSFYCSNVIFSDPRVPVIHQFGMCGVVILIP